MAELFGVDVRTVNYPKNWDSSPSPLFLRFVRSEDVEYAHYDSDKQDAAGITE